MIWVWLQCHMEGHSADLTDDIRTLMDSFSENEVYNGQTLMRRMVSSIELENLCDSTKNPISDDNYWFHEASDSLPVILQSAEKAQQTATHINPNERVQPRLFHCQLKSSQVWALMLIGQRKWIWWMRSLIFWTTGCPMLDTMLC
jgi:hypothetical protein